MSPKKPILIAYPDHSLRTTLARSFVSKGFETHSVPNGFEALKLIQAGLDPLFIVCSAKMAVLNGIGLAKQMEQFGIHAQMILITEGSDPGLDKMAQEHGAIIAPNRLDEAKIREFFERLCEPAHA